jgi:hypothetical protein
MALKYSDINLTNIKSLLIDSLYEDGNTNIEIPSTFYLNKSLLYDFNNRIFKPSNINNILSLCDYLMIEDTQNFIILNMEPSNDEYNLTDHHNDHYKLPKDIYKNMSMNEIAEHGLLKYMIKKYEHVYDPNIVHKFDSLNGQLECLIFGWQNDFLWSDVTFRWICCKGHLDCLKWLRSKDFDWPIETCAMCSAKGHLECLQYARNNGCTWTSDTCLHATINGHLDCLIWANRNGCPITDMICIDAIDHNHFDCLQYLVENGCKKHVYACAVASLHGNLKILKYLHENGFCWGKYSYWNATCMEHKDCLQYIKDNDCPQY